MGSGVKAALLTRRSWEPIPFLLPFENEPESRGRHSESRMAAGEFTGLCNISASACGLFTVAALVPVPASRRAQTYLSHSGIHLPGWPQT